ncbi:MAG: hypothetical protein OXB92_06450 [Acidimicrobiaceae bacterium]|nr:hypothetical protein [Acidimicrobiaceae bacterium]
MDSTLLGRGRDPNTAQRCGSGGRATHGYCASRRARNLLSV